MRRLLLIAAMIGVVGSRADRTKQPANSNTQTKEDETLVQRIQAGDTAAITEAGKSGDKFFVPYLRRELRERRHPGSNPNPISAARLALAKLGETQQLQEEWCIAVNDYPEMRDFGYIGGWFGIQALQKFLSAYVSIHPYRGKHQGTDDDVLYPPPSYIALKTLQDIVPNPPVKFDPDIAPPALEQSAKIWQDWISAHTDELSKLEPTGEGVDFSDKACKNGKPRKKH